MCPLDSGHMQALTWRTGTPHQFYHVHDLVLKRVYAVGYLFALGHPFNLNVEQ